MQLKKKLEKDANCNQQRFWASLRLNESRRMKESIVHINDKNGQVSSKKVEVIGCGNSTL